MEWLTSELVLHVFFVYTVPVEKPEILITIYISQIASLRNH